MKTTVIGNRFGRLLPGSRFDEAFFHQLATFASSILDGSSLVMVGGSIGWDQSVAQACIDLGISYHVCLPCDYSELRWDDEPRMRHYRLLKSAAKVEHVKTGAYYNWKTRFRNEVMGDRCERVISLWDGQPGGTTCECVLYANSRGVPVISVWEKWQNFLKTIYDKSIV